MKRLLILICLATVGFASGVVVGLFVTGLVPNCGDPCSIRKLGYSGYWALGLMLAFPIVGHFSLKKIGTSATRIVAVAAVLSLVVLLPAAAQYGFKLHQFYQQSTATLGVPDADFSYMAIATKPFVATYDKATIQIKAWERCALGSVDCDKKPRTVQAVCLGVRKAVLINEKDWPTFQRIPEEDLPGLLERPEDMHLCSAK